METVKRIPKSAAILIKGNDNEFSYANALKKARETISLKDIGIENTKIRKAHTGGVIIEVFGKDNSNKADSLANRLGSILTDVTVRRPVKRGDIRITGLDDSATPEELKHMIAEKYNIKLETIRVSALRTMENGMHMAWMSLPLAIAVELDRERKIRIGWTVARVKILNPRPRQCFRCWSFTHATTECKNKVDRTKCCFKCGRDNHFSINCTSNLCCVICKEAGLEHAHRMAGLLCGSVPRSERFKQTTVTNTYNNDATLFTN